ncbi:hypothetical protein SAMN04515668_4465 [Hymenobacter arizonensis]|uniref:Uncharacterized protein n=1 Tax=Hymenobacter arizonensis TaxID=1227077 RepID=A0A1I6BF82_HYMAR|nr:hypothetical protein SAMN04515668_4465 [Hymenobacter arizonensis]
MIFVDARPGLIIASRFMLQVNGPIGYLAADSPHDLAQLRCVEHEHSALAAGLGRRVDVDLIQSDMGDYISKN